MIKLIEYMTLFMWNKILWQCIISSPCFEGTYCLCLQQFINKTEEMLAAILSKILCPLFAA